MNTYDVFLRGYVYRVTASNAIFALVKAREKAERDLFIGHFDALESVTVTRVNQSEPVKLDGCTCEPTEEGDVRAYHFKECPWAMS